jgi:hypothetical protein
MGTGVIGRIGENPGTFRARQFRLVSSECQHSFEPVANQ